MRTRLIRLLAGVALCVGLHRAAAQGTAFTYQGQLNINGGLANGNYDFKFDSWSESTGGSVIGQPVTNTAVAVSNGLFITIIDFGSGVFNGTTNWLHVQVRTNGTGAFSSLAPRQELTPTPYAIYAETANAAGLSGTIPAGNLSGTYGDALTLSNAANSFVGNGSGLTGLNASQLTSGTVADALLAPDVALTDVTQTFTGTNIFNTGTNAGRLTVKGSTGIDYSLFTGLGLQYYSSSGEGAIMSSYNDGFASLSFFTKQGGGYPVAKQMIIDRYGNVAIDQQGNNAGVINNGTTNGAGLTFGTGSGEGIASQRTTGTNQYGLDFYTDFHHRMSILQNGNVGIGTTNPGTALQVNGTVTASGLQVNGPFTASSLALPVPAIVTAEGVSLIYADGNDNYFAGFGAGNPGSGVYNTANGTSALSVNTGAANTADGVFTLLKNTTGNNNTAVGADVMAQNINGNYNTAVGVGGLEANTSGSNNVAVGAYALGNSTTDSGLVAVGYGALRNDASGGLLTIGGANTAIGYQSLTADNSGGANTGVGYWSLYANLSGANNTAVGVWALLQNTSGSGNVAIGDLAGFENASGANNNIDIGNNGNGSDSGVIRIGTQGTQSNTYLSGTVAFDGGLNLDQTGTYGANSGSVSSSALTFGTGPNGSGEGIASQRTSGPNQFDLTLYTGFQPRLTIRSSGYVGIGTTNPSTMLEVNGTATVDGGAIYLVGPDMGNFSYDGLFWSDGALPGINDGSGPFLAGYYGGALGSTLANGVNLSWDYKGNVWVSNNLSTASLTIRGGADLAEPFNISSGSSEVPQGAVVVIDEQNPGHLKLSDSPYDTRVAGVVSGANGINPGIQMHQQGLIEGGKNVALTGRVYVQADASNGAIRPGDMLTTSTTPGHAMRVSDHARAAGAILGKAMTGLSEGKGMVLVLVTLQ